MGVGLLCVSPQGAFWGLMFGLGVGLVRMILEFSLPAPACGEVDRRPAVLKDFHYLYFALLLCGLTAIVIIAVSLCTAPIPEEKASGASHRAQCQELAFHGLGPPSLWPWGWESPSGKWCIQLSSSVLWRQCGMATTCVCPGARRGAPQGPWPRRSAAPSSSGNNLTTSLV